MTQHRDDDLHVRLGRDELLLRQRYEVLSILNDIAVALWFVAGSILFFSPDTTYAGTWLFLLGSLQLLVRPVIRLSRRIHLQRRRGSGLDSGGEY